MEAMDYSTIPAAYLSFTKGPFLGFNAPSWNNKKTSLSWSIC